jgi:hypothetical protein
MRAAVEDKRIVGDKTAFSRREIIEEIRRTLAGG